jgi:hypothetical protein
MSIKEGEDHAKVFLGAQVFRGGEQVHSDKFWIHENFTMPSAVNDIGLIELKNQIIPSKEVNFIGIDPRVNVDYDENGREVIIGGWGELLIFFSKQNNLNQKLNLGYHAPHTNSYQLRFTTMKLMPFHECKKFNNFYIESLTKDHICVENERLPCE